MALFSRGKTLYHPGPLAATRLPEVVAATKAVLKDFGIEFVTFDFMSGYEVWFSGHEERFAELRDKNKKLLKDAGVVHIITNDPHEAWTLRERYGIDAKHVLEIYKEHLNKIKKGDEVRANYHHPCFLVRLGVSATAAKGVLRRAGVHIASGNKDDGCCGSVGHDFERNNKEESTRIAKGRVKDHGEKTLITCCPHCIMRFKGHKKTVRDIAEFLVDT